MQPRHNAFMKLVMPILLILVVATFGGIALANSPPENVEPSKKKYLTAEEEAARWPSQVARDEMGPLMVQRGPGKAGYSFWNRNLYRRLEDSSFMIYRAYVRRDIYDQKELDEGRTLFLQEFAKANPACILILAYDDDTVLPIAYRLNDRGVYERQPADVAKSLVDQTRAPNGKDISLRDMAEMFDHYEPYYFCRLYTREGRSLHSLSPPKSRHAGGFHSGTGRVLTARKTLLRPDDRRRRHPRLFPFDAQRHVSPLPWPHVRSARHACDSRQHGTSDPGHDR